MTRFRLDRRALLRGAGGILVGLPLLEAMSDSRARAADRTVPKRFVVFYSPNGTNAGSTEDIAHETAFWPAQQGPNFVLGEEVSPLEPLRKKLLIASGINAESANQDNNDINPAALYHGDLHSIGMSQMLTGVSYIFDQSTAVAADSSPGGYAGGISIDQYMAQKLGGATRFPSLEFGVVTTTDSGVLPFSRMISTGPNRPVAPEEDPAAMFKRLFSDGTPTGGGAVDNALAQRKSVLDFVSEDFAQLKKRIGVDDYKKLDKHLTAVRALEMRLDKAPNTGGGGPLPASCATPTIGTVPDAKAKANFPTTGKLHMDLLALALKCDITRIASLQWSWARSQLVHTWAGASEGHHDMTHGPSKPQLTAINNWYAKQLAYLGQALDASVESDGSTLLDNTVIYWCSDVGYAYTHKFNNIRAFFLGSCGGALKTGQHVAVGGQNHQKLLVTLLNAMGIAENKFGNTAFGTGTLDGMLA